MSKSSIKVKSKQLITELVTVYFKCIECGKEHSIDHFSDDTDDLKDLQDKNYSEVHTCCGTRHTVEY